MKYIKILILALIITCSILPAKTFALFAEPDEYIRSMPFGVQLNDADRPKVEIPTILDSSDNKNFLNNTAPAEQPESQNEKKEGKQSMGKIVSEHGAILQLLIFFSAVFVIIILFILLKIRKVI